MAHCHGAEVLGASAVLPLRLGEFVRPAMLGRRLRVGLSAPLSSIVVERFIDILSLIACALIVGIFYPLPDALRAGAGLLGVGAVFALVMLVMLLRHQARAERVTKRLLARLPERVESRARPVLRGLINGLGGLSGKRTVALVVAYSAYLWGVIAFTFTRGMMALDLPVRQVVLASLTTLVSVALMVFLPNAPGYLGTWHLGCTWALRLFGVDESAAIAFAWLTWVVNMVVTVGGLGVFLAREGLSFGDVLHSAGPDAPVA